MAFENDYNRLDKAPALAGAFRAVRGELPGGDDLSDTDISLIQHGGQAVTGKAVWSTNSAARMARDDADQKREQDEKKQDAQQARELAHLSVWNGQMTNVGGVAMTNAQAQDARQHIIDHGDFYADKAAREGRIRDDEKEEYKSTVRRIRELEEKRGRGVSTKDEDRDCDRLKHSRTGRAAEQDAGEYHMTMNGLNNGISKDANQANASFREVSSAPMAEGLFKGAPDVASEFRKSAAQTQPESSPAASPEPPSPAKRVAAMGLDV